MKSKHVTVTIFLCLLIPFCWAGNVQKAKKKEVSGGSTACVGYSNDDANCTATLDASSYYARSGNSGVLCRKWVATTSGTVSKITVSIHDYTSGTLYAVFYIGTSLTAYKQISSPSAGELEVDMSTGATGTLTFSNSDTIYYGLSYDTFYGGIERDESVSQPPANYWYDTGGVSLQDPATWSENATRELPARLEYTY